MRLSLFHIVFFMISYAGGGEDISAKARTPLTTAATPAGESSEPECMQASDCAPAACCRATWCAPGSVAPICEGVGCRAVGRPQSLDSMRQMQASGCLCVEGHCGAKLGDGCVVVGPQPPAQPPNELHPPTCPPTGPSQAEVSGG